MSGMASTKTADGTTGTTPELDRQIIELLQKEMLDKSVILTRETRREDVSIDSIDIVNVVFAIEEKYDIEVNLTPRDRFDTVGDLIDALAAFIPEDKR